MPAIFCPLMDQVKLMVDNVTQSCAVTRHSNSARLLVKAAFGLGGLNVSVTGTKWKLEKKHVICLFVFSQEHSLNLVNPNEARGLIYK